MNTKALPDADKKVEPHAPLKLALNMKEVSELLSVSVRTVWKMASCREIPAPFSIGRSKRWSRHALERWIVEHHASAQRR